MATLLAHSQSTQQGSHNESEVELARGTHQL